MAIQACLNIAKNPYIGYPLSFVAGIGAGKIITKPIIVLLNDSDLPNFIQLCAYSLADNGPTIALFLTHNFQDLTRFSTFAGKTLFAIKLIGLSVLLHFGRAFITNYFRNYYNNNPISFLTRNLFNFVRPTGFKPFEYREAVKLSSSSNDPIEMSSMNT